MASSDFLSWDDDFNDLELDFMLGEYTDDDSVHDTKTCASSNKSQQCNANGYLCPICNKTLKSIRGFRGHTSKQHDRSDLKGRCLFIFLMKCQDY